MTFVITNFESVITTPENREYRWAEYQQMIRKL